MIKTKYTSGFDKFWKVWKDITGKESDKSEAFKYWKRDRLEGDEDELIRILGLQADERKRLKTKGEWQPPWCFCRKWLNKRRYEYIPEPPKKRETKYYQGEKFTEEEKEAIRYSNSPEGRKKRQEYYELVKKTVKKMDVSSKVNVNNRRNTLLDKLEGKA